MKQQLLEARSKNKKLTQEIKKSSEQMRVLKSDKISVVKTNFQLQKKHQELERDKMNLSIQLRGSVSAKSIKPKHAQLACDLW